MISYKQVILYYREKYIFLFSNLALGIILLAVIIIILKLAPHGDGLVPLHYDIFFGIDKIGLWYQALLFPSLAFMLLLVNFVIGYYIFTRDKYLSYYLSLMALILSMVSLIYIVVIISYLL